MSKDPQQTPPPENAGAVPSKGTVLLLDDDKFLLDMYAMKFVQQSFAVGAFLSVDEALKALRDGLVPDVILFDITMPERDGFSFLQALNEEKLSEHVPKIALTNESSDAERAKVMELGTDDYIVKATMIPSEVVNKISDLIGKHRTKS